MRRINRLVDTYRMLRENETRAVEEANVASTELQIVNMIFRRDPSF